MSISTDRLQSVCESGSRNRSDTVQKVSRQLTFAPKTLHPDRLRWQL